MSKSRKPPGSRSDVLLNELLAAIGKGDLNPFQRYPLIAALEKIWSAYAERPGELTAEERRRLRKFRADTAKRRAQRKGFNPDEIVIAGWLRANPDADELELREQLEDLKNDGEAQPSPAEVEEEEDRAIAYRLSASYRKRDIRKLVVEPFILFLKKNRIAPSSRKLPLNHMTKALFDWLEIEPGSPPRPADAGINAIARDLKLKRRGKARR